MRKSPTILAMIFILITLVRVAEFSDRRMQAGLLGWLFSIALGAGVYFFAWFTREHISKAEGTDKRSVTVQRWSWGGLAFFVVVDGIFNGAEVWLSVNPQTTLMIVTTVIYGVFPTLAAAALGALQGHVDRLPVPPPSKNAVIPAIRRLIASKINGLITEPPVVTSEPQRKEIKVFRYYCERCGFGTDVQREWAGHCNSKLHKAGALNGKHNGKIEEYREEASLPLAD
jgi:hypothetical protein